MKSILIKQSKFFEGHYNNRQCMKDKMETYWHWEDLTLSHITSPKIYTSYYLFIIIFPSCSAHWPDCKRCKMCMQKQSTLLPTM